MNTVSVVTKKDNETPQCFGKEWDSRSAECAGGPDANFTDANGGHIRQQCGYFQSCGSRTTAMRGGGSLMPASQLHRQQQQPVAQPQPQQPPPGYRPYPQATDAYSAHRAAIQAADQQRQAVLGVRPPQPMTQPPQYQQYQQPQGYAQTYQLNYSMPAYLSTPEHRHPDETVWSVLFREVVRAMFKAVGHSVSHFFDSRPMKDKDK